jgi:guanine deaminase
MTNTGGSNARDLIVTGATVVDDDGSWSAGNDIVILDGQIASVGPSARHDVDLPELPAEDKLALPGFVNSHTHTSNNLLRGTGDTLWLETHLINSADAAQGWRVEDYYASAALGAIEMVRTGTAFAFDMVKVTGADWREKVDAVFSAYTDVGLDAVIAPTLADLPYTQALGRYARDLPPDVRRLLDDISLAASADEQLERLEQLAADKATSAEDGVRLGVAPVNPTQCSDSLLIGCASVADRFDLPLQTHCLESKLEAMSSYRTSRTVPDRLAAIGFLGPAVSLAHAVWLANRDVELIADAGAAVVHNPMSNLKLGSGIAPIRQYLDGGIRVALGTDSVASSDSNSVLQAAWLAAILSHATSPDPDRWLSARDAVSLALTSVAGDRNTALSLKPGQPGNVVLVDRDSSFLTPRDGKDAYALVAYAGVTIPIASVVIRGRLVMRDGRILGVSEGDIVARAEDAWKRFLSLGISRRLPVIAPFLHRIQQRLATERYLVERHAAME